MYTNDDSLVAHIDPTAATEDSSFAERLSTAKLTRPAEAVLRGTSSCELVEGGLGI